MVKQNKKNKTNKINTSNWCIYSLVFIFFFYSMLILSLRCHRVLIQSLLFPLLAIISAIPLHYITYIAETLGNFHSKFCKFLKFHQVRAYRSLSFSLPFQIWLLCCHYLTAVYQSVLAKWTDQLNGVYTGVQQLSPAF